MTAQRWAITRFLAAVAVGVVLLDMWAGWALPVVIVAIVVMVMGHEFGHFITAKRAGLLVTDFFVGFGPVGHPKYVVVCVIGEGGYGADAAAPLVAKTFDYLVAHPVGPLSLHPDLAPPTTTTTTPRGKSAGHGTSTSTGATTTTTVPAGSPTTTTRPGAPSGTTTTVRRLTPPTVPRG